MKVILGGGVRLAAKLHSIAANVDRNVKAEVAEVGKDLLDASQAVTPMAAPDGGQLRASGYVDHSIPGTAEVGYTAKYAVYVHEMGITVYPEWAPIGWTTPGTGAKFLEAPFVANRQRYADRIKDAARRGVRRG